MASINYIGSVDTLYILNKIKNVLDNGYVAKDGTKQLSDENFTTALLNSLNANTTKLAGIADGATKTEISNTLSAGTKIATIKINGVDHDIYTVAATLDSAMSDTSENAVQNKVIKKYVDDAVGAVTTIDFRVVDALPETGESNVIYLVPNGSAAPNTKDEYIWITSESKFEKIGSTTVDLSNYTQFSDFEEISTDDIDIMFTTVWG